MIIIYTISNIIQILLSLQPQHKQKLETICTKKTLHEKRSSYLEKQEDRSRASLVAQWLGICLPMQGTRVRALVWEDPTCHGATGPVSHNY